MPTLAKFYHQASEAYEQACTRHISMIIYYVSHSSWPLHPPQPRLNSGNEFEIQSFYFQQFERLFQFARRIEDLLYTIPPEEVCSLLVLSLDFPI